MCTYLTERAAVRGSGKGPGGWIRVTDATVYFDHPQHAPAEHTLNIDFLDPAAGPAARVAVELTLESAEALVRAIEATLASVPPALRAAARAGPAG
jgi:hypothetical protein